MSDLHSINEAINKRAGRKLLPSIAVSLSFIAGLWALLSFFRFGIAVVVAIAVSLAIKEIAHAFKSTETYVSYRSLLLSSIGISAAAWFGGIRGVAIGTSIAMGLILIGLLRKGPQGFVKSASASVFSLVYLPFLTSFAILLARPSAGFGNVMTLIVLVSCNDTFGYVVGVLLGKHPMAPHISPKKSWEGLAGSVIFTAIGGYLSFKYLLDINGAIGAAVGLLVVITATTGDLIESSLKRDFAVKDMGNILPGHGGMMDRLDSIVLTAPALWLVLELVKRYI
jgi:phosphatidate cytidylyltransferase